MINLTLNPAGTRVLQFQLSLCFVIVIELEDEVIESPVVGPVQDIIRVRLTSELHILASADNHPGVGLGGLRAREPRPLLDLQQPDAPVCAVLVARDTVVLTNEKRLSG